MNKSKNADLGAAKTARKDEFYISSSWKLLSFRLDEGNDIGTRNTAIGRNGGEF